MYVFFLPKSNWYSYAYVFKIVIFLCSCDVLFYYRAEEKSDVAVVKNDESSNVNGLVDQIDGMSLVDKKVSWWFIREEVLSISN